MQVTETDNFNISIPQELIEKVEAKERELAEITFKVCCKCGQNKPLTEYQRDVKYHWRGNTFVATTYKNMCNECCGPGGDHYYHASKQIRAKLGMKRPPLGHPCDLCKRTDKLLVFDHDHKTKEFRGWLCSGCNTALGKLGDSLESLLRAIKYLLPKNIKARQKLYYPDNMDLLDEILDGTILDDDDDFEDKVDTLITVLTDSHLIETDSIVEGS